jgi:NAD(P)-dependent dehydrogenase (short-subunit alcohol dehydrogenase family)
MENGNGTNGHEAVMEEEMPQLTTLPPPDANFKITLQDKVIAITGANRGIGLGIAEVVLANEAKVVYSLDLMDPSEDFDALAKKFPGRFKYKQMDVTDEESVKKAIDEIVDEEGAIHGMVSRVESGLPHPSIVSNMLELLNQHILSV